MSETESLREFLKRCDHCDWRGCKEPATHEIASAARSCDAHLSLYGGGLEMVSAPAVRAAIAALSRAAPRQKKFVVRIVNKDSERFYVSLIGPELLSEEWGNDDSWDVSMDATSEQRHACLFYSHAAAKHVAAALSKAYGGDGYAVAVRLRPKAKP